MVRSRESAADKSIIGRKFGIGLNGKVGRTLEKSTNERINKCSIVGSLAWPFPD